MAKTMYRSRYYRNYQAPDNMAPGTHIRVNEELAALALNTRALERERAERAARGEIASRRWWAPWRASGTTRRAVEST
ncbi:MAG: hypothetical protein NTU77_05530 [Actinobacteria bacterium]|nr:hypothetical protein [Actinomycetota bacterium]